MTEAVPYFDDTRKALAFALNYEGETKAPVMSRFMAQLSRMPRRASKATRKRFLAQVDAEEQPELYAFLVALLEGHIATRKSQRAPSLPKGLDGAFLAGHVLAHFGRLDAHHQALLRGRVIQAYSRCSCGAPCCSGWRRHPVWARAVLDICDHLQRVGEVLRVPGRRGLSSQPAMRLAIVEQYLTLNSLTLGALARLGQVALDTAAKHKEWITTYLAQEEDSAWRELDAIFDSAGITGAFA